MPDFRRAVLLALLLPMLPLRAEPLPLWEAGIGAGAASLPDYRGSDLRRTRVVPVPYLVYRGRIFKADREGVRAAFFESGRVQLNLSLNVGPAAGGSDNPLRRGMHDLRPTVEAGPTVDIALWRAADGGAAVDLRLPWRAAFTVESSPKRAGALFSPNLHLDLRSAAFAPGWKLSAQAGPVFATRAHHAYYYSVSSTEALPGRPAYAAPGGYSGLQAAFVLSKRFARHWVGAYLRYDNLDGAAFADSPLVRQRSALAVGVGAAWIFGVSGTTVDAVE